MNIEEINEQRSTQHWCSTNADSEATSYKKTRVETACKLRKITTRLGAQPS